MPTIKKAGDAIFRRFEGGIREQKNAIASTPGLKRDFGCPFGEHLAPQALLTVLWDIGGNVPVDWRLGANDGSENEDLADMLGSLVRGDILLADRLFPGRELLADLHRGGVDYICP